MWKTSGVSMHPDQLSVTVPVVEALVVAQFPQWAGLPIRPVAGAGTVNAIFRVGDDVVARFPLELADDVDELRVDLETEAAAAAELNGRTPVATPRPLGIGSPGLGYAQPWSLYSWTPGEPVTADSHAHSDAFARDLVEFIGAVRQIDARGRTYDGNGRGGDLASHDEWVDICLTNSVGLLDVAQLRSIWDQLRILPRGDTPDVMTHGDLIPPNILTTGNRMTGILDVGGFKAVDPALDLVSAWHLLDTERRAEFRIQLDCDEAEWLRSCGWAFEQAIGAVWYYAESNPAMSTNCRRTLERIQTHFASDSI